MPRTSKKSRSRTTKSRRPRPKSKFFTLKNILVAIVVAFVAIGGAAAFALSQMNQDSRSQAASRCDVFEFDACEKVDGCSWSGPVLNCSSYEADACPLSDCRVQEGSCDGPPGCENLGQGACRDICDWRPAKCTGGSFARGGVCTGTPTSTGGGGNSGGGNSGGGNSGGGNSGGGSSGGGNSGGGSTGGGGGNSGGGSGGGSSSSAKQPKGYFDVVNGSQEAFGWACDPNNYNEPLKIHFYVDDGPGKGTFIGETTANVGREAAVGNECGGRSASGFKFKIPSQYLSTPQVQNRKIYAYAIDIGPGANANTNKHLTKSPLTFKTVAIDNTPASGTFSANCSPASGQTYGDLRYELKVTGTTPKNVGSVVFFLGFFGKQHSKELSDDFLGKPTWSDTCHDQGWCGYWLKQVNDPNPGANETISWVWSGDHKFSQNGKTINELATRIAQLKSQGKLPANYKLAVHAEYRLPDGSRYKFDGKDTMYLDITPTGCGASPTAQGAVTIRARGTLAGGAYPVMELRKLGTKLASWSVDNTMRDYTAELPASTTLKDITVNFVNDYYDPVAKQDRNLEVDYLKLGSTVYQSESPNTFSVGTWGGGSCAAGKKQSQWLHCNGYFSYASVEAPPAP